MLQSSGGSRDRGRRLVDHVAVSDGLRQLDTRSEAEAEAEAGGQGGGSKPGPRLKAGAKLDDVPGRGRRPRPRLEAEAEGEVRGRDRGGSRVPRGARCWELRPTQMMLGRGRLDEVGAEGNHEAEGTSALGAEAEQELAPCGGEKVADRGRPR